jgi:hypothetical protein
MIYLEHGTAPGKLARVISASVSYSVKRSVPAGNHSAYATILGISSANRARAYGVVVTCDGFLDSPHQHGGSCPPCCLQNPLCITHSG